jgi:hypothetical protein
MCSNIIERLNLIVSTDSQLLWGHTHTFALFKLQYPYSWATPTSGRPHGAPFIVLWSLYSKHKWHLDHTSMRSYIGLLCEATTALCDPYSSQGSIMKEKEHPLHNVISKNTEQLYGMSSEVVNTGLLLWSQFQELTDRYSGKPHWDDSFFSALLRRFFMRQPLTSSIQYLEFHLSSLARIDFPAQGWRKRRCIMQFFISQTTALAVQHTSSKDSDPPEIQLISALGELLKKTVNVFRYTMWEEGSADAVYIRWLFAFPFTILICLSEESRLKILQSVWKEKVQTTDMWYYKRLWIFEEIMKGQWDSFFNELRKSHFRSCQLLILFLVSEDGKTLDPDFRRVMVEVYPDRPVDYYDKPYDFALEKKTSRLLKRYYQEHILDHDPPNLVLDPSEESDFIISPFHQADSWRPFRTEVHWGFSGSASIIDMGSTST